MSKLYDVFEEKEGASIFVMKAPLTTISQFYKMHRDAEARLVRETDANGFCVLHFGRLSTAMTKIIIRSFSAGEVTQ